MPVDTNKLDRLKNANELIQVISKCGRRFFQHKGYVSTLELSDTGRVFFVDYYTKKRIYTHYSRRWSGFTSGGTLRRFVEALRDYITKGHLLNPYYFESSGPDFPHPWAYNEDLATVKNAASRLGMLSNAS